MKNRVHFRLAASAAAIVGALAVAGTAAAREERHYASSHTHRHLFERPRLRHRRLVIVGTDASDKIALRLAAGRSDVLEVDVGDDGSADFRFHLQPVDAITVDAGAGDDLVRIDESNGAFTNSIPTTIAGGDGNDTLLGGSGRELFIGGSGNDTVDGNGGNDLAFLGSGDDSFVWDPGDGSDRIEGQDGNDTMVFNGAAASEQFDLAANGDRLTFARSPGNITMDTHGVENVDVNALGGADSIAVHDLTGTGVSAVNVDLAGALGGAAGDGQTDRVAVDATNGDDIVNVTGDASGVAVAGAAARVAIQHAEPTDELDVNGLDGIDSISATGLAAGTISTTLDGGAGGDRIAGSQGVEKLIGGDGNDSIDGNGGNDVADLGAGDDTFFWDPGDGSDTIEGGDGNDTMLFNGAAAAEQVAVSANGGRVTFFRNPGNITMDTRSVENIDFNALGGADVVTVNDLAGTGVTNVRVDLAGALGGSTGDAAADRVVVNGTNGDDHIAVSNGVKVSGLAATVDVLHSEAANDRLEINTLAGHDTVDHSGLAAGAVQLLIDGIIVP
ncbi:MAG TPA: calcium-binding protein [Gaiellaceae bacterium]